MVQIELAEKMAERVREIVDSHLSELRMEIAYTNRKKFREYLKRRAELLEGVLGRPDEKLAVEGRASSSPYERLNLHPGTLRRNDGNTSFEASYGFVYTSKYFFLTSSFFLNSSILPW
jgi:hypothetical protein